MGMNDCSSALMNHVFLTPAPSEFWKQRVAFPVILPIAFILRTSLVTHLLAAAMQVLLLGVVVLVPWMVDGAGADENH
jgi:hypothetical protein